MTFHMWVSIARSEKLRKQGVATPALPQPGAAISQLWAQHARAALWLAQWKRRNVPPRCVFRAAVRRDKAQWVRERSDAFIDAAARAI